MSAFTFKQFTLQQQSSAMKIGTDSVLLGCLVDVANASSVLDIGTGTGLLSLMIAQRNLQAIINAVEIDEQAAHEAQHNFTASPWANRLNVYANSIQQFAATNTIKYQLIISNPPYFLAGKNFEITNEQRLTARQNSTLPFNELAKVVQQLLAPAGSFWLILPSAEAAVFLVQASELYLQQQINMVQKEGKEANRIIMQFGLQKAEVKLSTFVVFNADGTPTEAYKKIARDFYTGKQFQ